MDRCQVCAGQRQFSGIRVGRVMVEQDLSERDGSVEAGDSAVGKFFTICKPNSSVPGCGLGDPEACLTKLVKGNPHLRFKAIDDTPLGDFLGKAWR